ncbi:MAG: hypothetical protein IKK33_03040 [Lachnospiraceae bacterium]|nr:hypothetical protein [Lachnospiraceae bacterium]
MKKCLLWSFYVLFLVSFCTCGLNNGEEAAIEQNEKSSIIKTEYSSENNIPSTMEGLQTGYEYMDIGLFSDKNFSSKGYHFLVTEEITLEGRIYKTNVNDTNIVISLLQNLQVKKVSDMIPYADYYLLFRDKNNTATYLIEVWDRYICINHSDFYEMASDELFITIGKIINKSEELNKISINDILISFTKEYLYGEFEQDDIFSYNGRQAILVESGYKNNYLEDQIYYEKIIYYDGLYFDKDYQTTCAISQSRIYYCNGEVQDSYCERVAYYDYFTGKRRQNPY